MAQKLTVHQDGAALYDILIESDFEKLGKAAAAMQAKNRKACIVTDTNVGSLYADEVQDKLRQAFAQVDIFSFPAGESHKTLDTVKSAYRFLIEHRYDRRDVLVALGGGVVGDLCGFTAATYLRGVRFIQIPTTLLAQVDSGIGGKTGVDFDAFKNMVGAFHMPSLVYSSIGTLKTLTDAQFACGMGEVVKHGLIKDREYLSWLKTNSKEILERQPGICEQMVFVSDCIKRGVVEADPREEGERALLNFGHTLGHAIEKLMDFKLFHGQCVALGCLASAFISCQRGNLSFAQVREIRDMMRLFGLPSDMRGLRLDPMEIVETTRNDKKMDAGKIKFILLRAPGTAYVDKTVTKEEMIESLRWLTGGEDEG